MFQPTLFEFKKGGLFEYGDKKKTEKEPLFAPPLGSTSDNPILDNIIAKIGMESSCFIHNMV
jgi:hypothetical protein